MTIRCSPIATGSRREGWAEWVLWGRTIADKLGLPPLHVLLGRTGVGADAAGIGRLPRPGCQGLATGHVALAVLLDGPEHAGGEATIQCRAIAFGGFGGDPSPGGLLVAALALRLGDRAQRAEPFAGVGMEHRAGPGV